MAAFYYLCDESYDSTSKHPRTYVVAGFIATEKTWNRVHALWDTKNKNVGVKEFHASHLNAKDHEFAGWTGQRSKRYTKDLIKILADQKQKLWVMSVGMLARDYESIISEAGRRKLGSPYIACFKECVTTIAESLYRDGNPEDKFTVIFDTNEFRDETLALFYQMKDDKTWEPRRHLLGCLPSDASQFTGLQAADLIAYETFKLIHQKHFGAQQIRKALQKLLPHNGFTGFYYDADTFRQIKAGVEAAECGPNCFVLRHLKDSGPVTASPA